MIETALDIAFSPALWLSVGLGFACGLLAFLLRGGGGRQLGGDLVTGIVGFGSGQILGMVFGFNWLLLGQIRLVPGLGIAILTLALRRWLTTGSQNGARP